jgi:hypothetical protein
MEILTKFDSDGRGRSEAFWSPSIPRVPSGFMKTTVPLSEETVGPIKPL